MSWTVHNGIEDALAPETPAPAPVGQYKPPLCLVQKTISEYGGTDFTLLCTKVANHDDPNAEIGSHQTDPIHQSVENRHDGVLVTYTWRSDR